MREANSIRIRKRSEAPSVTLPDSAKSTRPTADDKEGRLARLNQIGWWDAATVRRARFMVVGAGALGNEVLKNLALVGVGRIAIVDFDVIEESNLSRSVLYREADVGKPKAMVAAQRVQEINPDVQAVPLVANILGEVGTALFKEFDAVIGAVDSREARLAINRSCWKTGVPYIDGGLGIFSGVVKVFVPPDSPCYECTMYEEDYRLLPQRQSCGLLKRNALDNAGIPTTPISASVVGAMQAQEALKLLHDNKSWKQLIGAAYEYDGLRFDSFGIVFQRRQGEEECMSHETYGELVRVPGASTNLTLRQLLALGEEMLGKGSTLDLEREILWSLVCPACGQTYRCCRPLALYTFDDAPCPRCGSERRGHSFHSVDNNALFLDESPLTEIGLPMLDVYTVRKGHERVHLVPDGDLKLVFPAPWEGFATS